MQDKNSTENRFDNNQIIKIKRLKIGMILALIAGALFVTSLLLIGINQNWYTFERQRIYIDYSQGLISSEQYNDLLDQLELHFYGNIWLISIFSTIAKVGVYCVFIFIIISLLSIILDNSFNRKMRRLALGLAGIMLLFLLYPIIASPNIVYNIYYGFF